MKKISILYGLPDTNSGGAALGIALINLCKQFFPNYKINYISSHKSIHLIEKCHPYIRSSFPDVNIIPYPINSRSDHYEEQSIVKKRLKDFIWAARTFFSVLHLILPFLLKNRTIKEIKESNLIIARGTNIFYDKKGTNMLISFLSKYFLCFPLLLARRLRKDLIIWGQSIGPLQSSANRILIRYALSGASLIFVREHISYVYVKDVLKIPHSKIKLIPDSVFAISPIPTTEAEEMCKKLNLPFKRYLVISVRPPMEKGFDEQTTYKVLIKIHNALNRSKVVEKTVIVTQSHHFNDYKGFECDGSVSAELFSLIEDKTNALLINQPLSPFELMKIYAGARYVLAMRLHAFIFALIQRTPSIVIAYFGHKTQGIAEMLGLIENCFDANKLDADEVIKRILDIEKSYDMERAKIDKIVSRMHQSVKFSFAYLAKCAK